jgi:hypothetical protein
MPYSSKRQMSNVSHSSQLSHPSHSSTLKDSLVSGMGSGVGFSLGDRLISSLLGPRTVEVVQSQPSSSPPLSLGQSLPTSESPTLSLGQSSLSSECQVQKQIYNSVRDILHLVKEETKEEFRKCGFIN